MTSKLVVNTIEADTGISSVSFGSSISLSSTSKFFFSDAGIDIGADTNINRPASGVLGFNINSSEKVRINSSGNARIGGTSDTTDQGYRLTLQGSSNATYLQFFDNGTGTTHGSDGSFIGLINQDFYVWNREAKDVVFGSSNNERLRIKSDGTIGINTTGNYGNIALSIYGADVGEGTAKGQLILKDNAAYDASPTAGIIFQGIHAAGSQAIFAGIRGFKENASNGNYAGALAFDVRAHGAVAYEALRITSGGYLKLGSTDGGAWHTIRLNTTTNNAIKDVLNIHSSVDGATAAAGFGVRLNFFGEQLNGNEYIYGSIAGLLSSSGSGYGDLAFYTNNNGTNTERLRINHQGRVMINTTNSSSRTLNLNGTFGILSPSQNSVIDMGINDSGQAAISPYRSSGSTLELKTNTSGSGVATRLRITSSGYVQTYSNPSFRAGLNSNTTFNQSTDIIFNDTSSTWHYNRGGHYNTSNGRFTAPVEGVYQFNACVIWYGAPNNTLMGDAFHYYVNGGNAAYSGRRAFYNTGTTGNSLYYTDHMSVNLYLNATDYVHIRQSSPVVTVHGNTYYTWFAGTFLG